MTDLDLTRYPRAVLAMRRFETAMRQLEQATRAAGPGVEELARGLEKIRPQTREEQQEWDRLERKQLSSIIRATCARCTHLVTGHMAEGDHPDLPGMMPCESPGCECVDFHRCDQPDCPECALANARLQCLD